jgi:hypothetical protein
LGDELAGDRNPLLFLREQPLFLRGALLYNCGTSSRQGEDEQHRQYSDRASAAGAVAVDAG